MAPYSILQLPLSFHCAMIMMFLSQQETE